MLLTIGNMTPWCPKWLPGDEYTRESRLPGVFWTSRFICKPIEVDSPVGCFWKGLFEIPRNTEFYTELTLFHVIPRNSTKFFTVQYREIPQNSAEFHIGSCIRNSVYLQTIIESTTQSYRDSSARFFTSVFFHQKYPPWTLIHILSWFQTLFHIHGVIRIEVWLPTA